MQKSTNNCDELSSTNNSSLSSGENSPINKYSENEEFQINLNDFLEFLNLSCHVNDMIARSERLPKEISMPPDSNNISTMKNQSGSATTTCKTEINFKNLSENRLVNNLLGFKPTNRNGAGGDLTKPTDGKLQLLGRRSETLQISPSQSTATMQQKKYRGLHPKLNEQLDYVIKEGVLDSVLSFICPVPIPVPLTAAGRAKAKQAKQESVKQTCNVTQPAAHALTTEVQSTPIVVPTPAVESPKVVELAVAPNVSGTPTDANNVVRASVKEPPSGVKTNINSTSCLRRKSFLTMAKDTKRADKKESEVIIHVCDEVKNTSRDFSCPQNLLVTQMGYFADVCAGQRLEEMDISVHCDIQIFDWLMKWVKHTASSSVELQSPTQTPTPGPQLDGSNVVPILVSASFLQMEPLLLECLTFCHAHLSEVVRTSTNLSCLNDAIVTRLAAMFTNLELEMVRDKKERVTPRLWTKLIQSLCEPEPEALRGHFYSMSGLFRCGRCSKCVTNTMKSYVNCVPANIRLNRWGQLVNHHVRDSAWDVNVYITQLFKEFKSWRKVYWRLWGHCHYLYCCTCEMHFPVYQMNWCRYHPENPSFLGPQEEGRIAGPAGRYACCGQQAFRYETLPGPNGCQFREHSVLVETDRERAILAIAQLVSENYALCDNPPTRMLELAAAGEIPPVWYGISLTPQRCRPGLLPQLCMEVSNVRMGRHMRSNNPMYYFETSTESETTSTSEDDVRNGRPIRRSTLRSGAGDDNGGEDDFTSSSSDGCESVHRIPKKKKRNNKKKKKRQTDVPGRFWCGDLSARSNQDHQREFEEKVMKQVIAYVNKKTGSDQNIPHNSQPLGGTYVRLEAEWKEQVKQRHSFNHHHGPYPGNNTCLPYSYQPKTKLK